MTTRVHVVNLGPDVVDVYKVVPGSEQVQSTPTKLYAHDSVNEFVYDSQELRIKESPVLKSVESRNE